MPTWPPLDRPALILAAAGLAVGAGLALAVAVDASDQPVRARAPLPAVPALAGPTAMGLSAEPGEAARRPLFTPDRRPPLKGGGAVAPDGPDLQVTGVVTGAAGGAATGLDRKTQKPFSVRLGDDLQGWTVEAIGRATLRLRRGAAVRDYPLVLPPPPAAGVPIVPAATPAPTPSPAASAAGGRAPPPSATPTNGAPSATGTPPPSGVVPGPTAPSAKPSGAPPATGPAAANPPPPDPQQLDAQPSHPPSRPPPDSTPRQQP
ncbi:hypothetical protein [Nitrospirillum viridazoti]|uniref:Type II secretion system protein GspC N-terminal domain-containing protein n=1 Tax=Nitrospirillum viridazoti CBAmc TaxID=1441467 RepID=A0A248JUP8_9PROT|nr:hypothetical protein [Nitrospirillum amazonense]ASG22447.1 hypothetical protein Y958_16010 [Nitrospirillum amazonense CBAmc]TWB43009.1 hypothetical protein FBZ91_102225 [Nitrospirillum amazonense]